MTYCLPFKFDPDVAAPIGNSSLIEYCQTQIVRPIGVVESEKTAVIASIFFEDYVWIATGGCMNLRFHELLRLAGRRQITLFPDSTHYSTWSQPLTRPHSEAIRS